MYQIEEKGQSATLSTPARSAGTTATQTNRNAFPIRTNTCEQTYSVATIFEAASSAFFRRVTNR